MLKTLPFSVAFHKQDQVESEFLSLNDVDILNDCVKILRRCPLIQPINESPEDVGETIVLAKANIVQFIFSTA